MGQVGVIPLIFATEILEGTMGNHFLNFFFFLKSFIPFLTFNHLYWFIYFILVLALSFFYSSLDLNTIEISNELQSKLVSIPGIKPGENTNHYIKKLIRQITLLNSILLIFVILIINLVKKLFPELGLSINTTSSILILIGTISDLYRQIRGLTFSNIYNI